MSRIDVNGEKFDLAFGVDHVTGAFVQLWVKPAIEQDVAIVIIDSHGVQIDVEQMKLLDDSVLMFLDKQKERFAKWKKQKRVGLPNIDEELVINFANCIGGFPPIAHDVYRVFGDDI